MYGQLYQYLVFYKKLNVPGIGTLLLERKPAEFDHAERVIHPSTYSISLHHGGDSPSQQFLKWLAGSLHTNVQEAARQFNDFVAGMRNEVMAGHKLNWENVGVLSKGMAGEVRFESAVKAFTTDLPVPAIKIVRENAEHMVRVGEDQKTSAQMIEILNPEKEKRSLWWAAALILTLAALLFMIIYFSQKGMTPSSAGNQQIVSPGQPGATYQVLQ